MRVSGKTGMVLEKTCVFLEEHACFLEEQYVSRKTGVYPINRRNPSREEIG